MKPQKIKSYILVSELGWWYIGLSYLSCQSLLWILKVLESIWVPPFCLFYFFKGEEKAVLPRPGSSSGLTQPGRVHRWLGEGRSTRTMPRLNGSIGPLASTNSSLWDFCLRIETLGEGNWMVMLNRRKMEKKFTSDKHSLQHIFPIATLITYCLINL